ncbi:tRNA threonylcarbamoyladenosine dehydratase [Aedoeadaptatus pacaensis]|uniref:tRNA threonylcarbamoyladenosine dehydratase n=1 Tax=Aedoeadaptatus pacaensis TaxID=1776390 RepID=UPI000837C99E|nr:tRNA threonylcarbamoyladenosine dehydratase [Peptoniphilus pacaensis]
MDPFLRTRWLIGTEAVNRLQQMRVAVFGVGGVGGFCIEALARAGVGALDIVDYDRVDVTNINRQIIATTETVGALKVDVMKERLASIVPKTAVRTYHLMYNEATADEINFGDYDYVVDAVDQVTAKLLIIEKAQAAGVPVLSAMGAGNKLHPEALEIAMLSETKVCPLARVMRREVKKRGLGDFPVVYSTEEPKKVEGIDERSPASISFVPSTAGLIAASKVIRDLVRE